MQRFQLFLLGILGVLLLAACGVRQSQQAANTDYEMSLEPMTTAVGDTTLMVTVTDAEGNPVDDAELSIKGDMTHAGMQPVLAEASQGEAGVYEIPFEWTMGGDWVVTIDAVLPDGTTVSETFDDIVVEGDMEDMEEMDHSDMEMEEGEEMGEGDEHEHTEGEHADHVTGTVPNDGAVIRIVSPADGDTVAAGEAVTVEIETENFELPGDGNHWHLYMDDELIELVRDGRTSADLPDVPAGEHMVKVTMSNGEHEELEEGDMIMLSAGE